VVRPDEAFLRLPGLKVTARVVPMPSAPHGDEGHGEAGHGKDTHEAEPDADTHKSKDKAHHGWLDEAWRGLAPIAPALAASKEGPAQGSGHETGHESDKSDDHGADAHAPPPSHAALPEGTELVLAPDPDGTGWRVTTAPGTAAAPLALELRFVGEDALGNPIDVVSKPIVLPAQGPSGAAPPAKAEEHPVESEPVEPVPPRKPLNLWLIIAGIVLGNLLLGGGGWFLWTRWKKAQREMQALIHGDDGGNAKGDNKGDKKGDKNQAGKKPDEGADAKKKDKKKH